MTIPDEAVNAAAKAMADSIGHGMREKCLDHARAALTAAAPYMQGVKVKALDWKDHESGSLCVTDRRYDINSWMEAGKPLYVDVYTTMRRHDTLEAAKAAAQADYEARIRSEIKDVHNTHTRSEPSPREQALEEAEHAVGSTLLRHKVSDYEGLDSRDAYEAGQINGLESAQASLRALSSPDHADAGKVEGDGWTVEYEVYGEDEWQAASTDLGEALDYAFMYARDGMENVTIQEVRRRTLPASEGAE